MNTEKKYIVTFEVEIFANNDKEAAAAAFIAKQKLSKIGCEEPEVTKAYCCGREVDFDILDEKELFMIKDSKDISHAIDSMREEEEQNFRDSVLEYYTSKSAHEQLVNLIRETYKEEVDCSETDYLEFDYKINVCDKYKDCVVTVEIDKEDYSTMIRVECDELELAYEFYPGYSKILNIWTDDIIRPDEIKAAIAA